MRTDITRTDSNIGFNLDWQMPAELSYDDQLALRARMLRAVERTMERAREDVDRIATGLIEDALAKHHEAMAARRSARWRCWWPW